MIYLVNWEDDCEKNEELDADGDAGEGVLVDVDQLDAEEDPVVGKTANGPRPDEEQKHAAGDRGMHDVFHLKCSTKITSKCVRQNNIEMCSTK